MLNARDDALGALVGLLDLSYQQILEQCRDPRSLDRNHVAAVADVWDNNTGPALDAARRPTGQERQAAARVALRWMADADRKRRDWMAAQFETLGFDHGGILDGLADASAVPYLDYAGHLRPAWVELDRAAVASLAADYDLLGGGVRWLHIEAGGAPGTPLTGRVRLRARRRYLEEDPVPPSVPEIDLRLVDVRDHRLAHAWTHGGGQNMRPGFDFSGDEVRLTFGPDGFLSARRAEYHPDDVWWHRSSAAAVVPTPARRVANTVTDPRRRGPRSASDALDALVTVNRYAMLEIRMVRYPSHLHRSRVAALSGWCQGLGGATGAAAGERSAGARQRAALEVLHDLWARAGPWQGWLRYVLGREPDYRSLLPDAPPGRGVGVAAPVTLSAETAGRLDALYDFVGGRVRLFAVEPRTGQPDAPMEAVLHLEGRRTPLAEESAATGTEADDGGWGIVVLTLADVRDYRAHSALHTVPLTAPPEIRVTGSGVRVVFRSSGDVPDSFVDAGGGTCYLDLPVRRQERL